MIWIRKKRHKPSTKSLPLSENPFMPISLPCWPPAWPEIEAAARDCLISGQWGRYQSQACTTLEKRLAEMFGFSSVRLCCSGTAAVEISLRAAGVGSGDEVIVAAFDYPGNFRSIELLGARPVLVDIAEYSPSVDPSQLKDAGSDQVKAVIVSHLFGVPADMAALREECDRQGWVLVEDACQAIGLRIGDKSAGGFGDLGTLSFGGSKLISAGCGGAVVTQSGRFAARLSSLLDRPSEAFPIAPLAAAVIVPQLDRLDEMNRLRSDNANWLRNEIVPGLTRCRWESGHQAVSAYYKVAFSAESAQHRNQVVDSAVAAGLPIGAGFRSMSLSSERRCRKPVSLDRSRRLGETLFVLDHRALLIEPSQRQALAKCLAEVI